VPAKRNFQAFVDYAHTPDALENVLRSLRQIAPARIITVFGCGGDRDCSKRPLMAAAAETLSDKVIVTSDNPRSEEPMAIIREVEKGFRGASHEVFIDRESAIRRAVGSRRPGRPDPRRRKRSRGLPGDQRGTAQLRRRQGDGPRDGIAGNPGGALTWIR